MTLVVEETPTMAATQESPLNPLAPWRIRAGAFAVDVLPAIAVVTTMALASLAVPAQSVWWWLCVSVGGSAILLTLVNRLVLPVIPGWSLGRALFGITVEHADGEAIGPWRLLLRDMAHLLDTAAVLVGWLWPLWDARNRTFADMLLRTEALRAEPAERPENIRRWTAVALLTAAALCLGGAAVSYGVVYSRDRATEHTRAQIENQGPKMVAQMLTYDPKTMRDDFARAQSLSTEAYRGQLIAQQQIVEKGHPVINEYWPIAGSIQSASPDRATMLIFMQGRRGEGAEERPISATVRATFVRGSGNRWYVDELTPITKPKPPGNGK